MALVIEAIDGLDETEGGDLNEILERLLSPLVAASETASKGQIALDELLAGAVVVATGAREELGIRRSAHSCHVRTLRAGARGESRWHPMNTVCRARGR